MKYNKRKRLFLVLAIIWMIMIFGFSSRDGDLSGEDSGRVGRLVGEWFVPGFDEWSEVQQSGFPGSKDCTCDGIRSIGYVDFRGNL